MDAIYRAFQNSEFVDATLILEDGVNQLKVGIHKIMLCSQSDFFRNLFTVGREKFQNTITLRVKNVFAAYDIIIGLYGAKPKYQTLPKEYRYEIDRVICLDYWLLPYDLDGLFKTHIPPDSFDDLLELFETINFDDSCITFLLENLPKNYDLSVLSEEFRRKLGEFTRAHITLTICEFENYASSSVRRCNSTSKGSYSILFAPEEPKNWKSERKCFVKTGRLKDGIIYSSKLGQICVVLKTLIEVYTVEWHIIPKATLVKTLNFTSDVGAVKFSPDSAYLIVTTHGYSTLWFETSSFIQVFALDGDVEYAFSDDSTAVVVYKNYSFSTYRLPDFVLIDKMANDQVGTPHHLTFITRGMLSWRQYYRAYTYVYSEKKIRFRPELDVPGYSPVAYSPDKSLLAYFKGNVGLRIINPIDDSEVCDFTYQERCPFAFSKDSTKICLLLRNEAVIYNVRPLQLLSSFSYDEPIHDSFNRTSFTFESWFETLPAYQQEALSF